jgi:hypothetical protein
MHKNAPIITKRIYEALDSMNINYFYDWGNLLGIVREGHFLYHDNDIDIGVIFDTDKPDFTELKNALCAAGFSLHHHFMVGEVEMECVLAYKGVTVDFFAYNQQEGAIITHDFYTDPEIHYDIVNHWSIRQLKSISPTGFRYLEMYGTKLRIPENAEEMLVWKYGENWRTPIFEFSEYPNMKLVDGFALCVYDN